MGYGLQFPKELNIQPPLHEGMPRIPEPYSERIFYYDQYDLLELSKTQNWAFSEIRPDGIVGFAPGWNAMNMAHGIAFYLTLYREVHGAGVTVPFPGKTHGYYSTHSDTFQDILSKMEIYAALKGGSVPMDRPLTWQTATQSVGRWCGRVCASILALSGQSRGRENRGRAVGFTEKLDTVQGYRVVFDRMVTAKLIPDSTFRL